MGRAIFVMEFLDERDHWRVRRKNGETVPIEGREREQVLERADQFAREWAPSRLEIRDRKGMLQEERVFD